MDVAEATRVSGEDLSSELAGLVDALAPASPQGEQVWGIVWSTLNETTGREVAKQAKDFFPWL